MIRRSSGNPELSRRLAFALLITLIAVLILATGAAAVSSYLEASDNQDETLLSVASLLTSNQIDVQYDPALFKDSDYDDGVRVWEVGGNNLHGFDIKPNIKDGFHTIAAKRTFWRVLIIQRQNTNQRLAVVQKLSVSTEIAKKSAINTALPLLLLLLLIPLLVTWIVRHSFKPLNKLTHRIGDDNSLTLDSQNRGDIPVEVVPFVSAIDSLLEKNEAYNQRQRRFIADAAHELRTPITALSLEIENLEKAPDAKAQKSRQASLTKSVQRLQRLLNQLLDLARAQALDDQARKTVSFNDQIKMQIAELYILAEDKDIELVVNRNEAVEIVDVNNQLQHLIRNALSNAIKFAPTGGEVVVDLYREHRNVIFSVQDNGPGVAPEHLENLHEPFYRPDERSTGIGAGLGLAICHEIATALGGTLAFENRQPLGFSFQFILKS